MEKLLQIIFRGFNQLIIRFIHLFKLDFNQNFKTMKQFLDYYRPDLRKFYLIYVNQINNDIKF